MDRSAELRIPTIAVAVRITTTSKPIFEAELFAADEPRRNRSELIDDIVTLLDGPVEFVPVREHNIVRLIPKHAIVSIAIRRRDPDAKPSTEFPEEPSEVFMLYDRQHRVEIDVAGGKLSGLLLDSSPADRPRVIDYLNRATRFVRLWTSEDHVLINKSLIVEVVELPEVVE